MTSDALVSVIIPVYNCEKYIEKCIDSVLKQTYSILEILIVDDGSTDMSGTIIDKYAQCDSRVKVFHQENGGVSVARNTAIDLARGEYLIFVDSDDFCPVHMIEELLQSAKKYNADITIGKEVEYVDGKMLRSSNGADFDCVQVWDKKQAFKLLMDDEYVRNYSVCKLYKRSLFNEIRFPENIKIFEDMALMHKLFFVAEIVTFVPEILYYYRIDKSHDTLSHNSERDSIFIKNRADILIQRVKCYQGKSNSFYRKLAMSTIFPHVFSAIKYSLIEGDLENRNTIRDFLLENYRVILENRFVCLKDKVLVLIYCLPLPLLNKYLGI